LQLKVRQKFDELRQGDQGQVAWHMIDAAQSVDAVTKDIVAIVEQVLEQVANGKPLEKLWSEGTYDLSSVEVPSETEE
jgi:hypothetical protein